MKRDFDALRDEFDVLVCGGGIYGAWVAYDAALRGLKVALVEQGDWGSGTSSASSKLVHGGLRYLETRDLHLVRKALRERQLLQSIAPHRVWPLQFALPVYSDSRMGRLMLKAGLMLYDLLAGALPAAMRHRYLCRETFTSRFPFLAETESRGGFLYSDAQTDDARFVLELVAAAQALGAVCVNYARLSGWQEDHGHACGVLIADVLQGTEIEVHARQYVSASGRWEKENAELADEMRLSKGVHLVMPALPTSEAMLLTAKEDGRVFFLIPWYGRTLLGTTDTDYDGALDQVTVEAHEVDYLLRAANAYLKTSWAVQDVIASYAGLRVLRSSDAAHPSQASRDWLLRTSGNRVHHIIGGKLTSARQDAAQVVDEVCHHLGLPQEAETGETRLPWAPPPEEAGWHRDVTTQAREMGVDAESILWLIRRHGARIEQVLRPIKRQPELATRIVADVPLIWADLLHCARTEMVQALGDLLRRRLPLLILSKLDRGRLLQLAERVAPDMGWDADRIAREVETCLN